ncbi:hypothetical protein [Ferruginibacter sp. HRS2-29]|uniref:hypothetical protein n=1 Tax=Ferruginibacter sp. HRS2-29 TaxID=2487334 RepID=UPI0020CFB32F|nr:hypothetical protein [Ferruginibacter sp. HRS2-29]MCP9750705.1 hypothetical protein [Ferruginibacter sp. HRS2-29]
MKLLILLCTCAASFTSTLAHPASPNASKEALHRIDADTIPNINCLVYKIPLNAIQISDPETYLNSEIINFTVPGLPSSGSPVELRLLLDQHFPPHKMINHDTLTNDEVYAATIYRSLPKARLSINGQLFSGTLRLYCNSYWYDLGRRPYPSLSLIINSYLDGVLQKSSAVYDVGSLCSDLAMERPT